jgi:hypothetical protein
MIVVQHPQRVDAGDFRVRTLLPVDPPEIDAFVFERVGEGVKVRGEEGAVGAVECDGLARARVISWAPISEGRSQASLRKRAKAREGLGRRSEGSEVLEGSM